MRNFRNLNRQESIMDEYLKELEYDIDDLIDISSINYGLNDIYPYELKGGGTIRVFTNIKDDRRIKAPKDNMNRIISLKNDLDSDDLEELLSRTEDLLDTYKSNGFDLVIDNPASILMNQSCQFEVVLNGFTEKARKIITRENEEYKKGF